MQLIENPRDLRKAITPPTERPTHIIVIARRYRLTLPVAATVADLANIGGRA